MMSIYLSVCLSVCMVEFFFSKFPLRQEPRKWGGEEETGRLPPLFWMGQEMYFAPLLFRSRNIKTMKNVKSIGNDKKNSQRIDEKRLKQAPEKEVLALSTSSSFLCNYSKKEHGELTKVITSFWGRLKINFGLLQLRKNQ